MPIVMGTLHLVNPTPLRKHGIHWYAKLMKDITHSILNFWLGAPDSDGRYQPQKFWFKSSDEFDAEIRDKFLSIHHDATMRAYDALAKDADDYLAIVIVLDQFSRNMFRGQAKAFETDALALSWAKRAISLGYDMAQPSPSPRMFYYLPFEHSEDIIDQNDSVRLFSAMGDEDYTKYAIAHQKVIKEFGRFPHRNAALGRINTKDEEVYLSKPGAGF